MTAFLNLELAYVKKAGKTKTFLNLGPVYVKEARKIEGLP
ncbi:hypothetical protein HMPREF3213_03843 [Heyndrickxia coagulans]|uniref:Uncharacterized protein n=1 Tax=Heyndrickxia coagulans TaxID=1398 RepID=A0A133KA87_HEYCO|nr:hypothetical protein HMPREF3213_03843 [Heyndrickxia coagulans]